MNIIKTTRERLGINQKDFALLVGSHSDTISDWENSPKPPALSVERICRILLKRRQLPRPAVLVDWIRVDGGQVALERLVDQKPGREDGAPRPRAAAEDQAGRIPPAGARGSVRQFPPPAARDV